MSWSVATGADAGRSVAGVVPLALFPGLAAVCRRPLEVSSSARPFPAPRAPARADSACVTLGRAAVAGRLSRRPPTPDSRRLLTRGDARARVHASSRLVRDAPSAALDASLASGRPRTGGVPGARPRSREARDGGAARPRDVSSAVAAVRGGLDRVDLSSSAFPHLPAFAREGIPAEFDLFTTTVAEASTSADGSTTKIVVSLQDGHRVEAVVMRHDKGRNALCVSSQVGCKMGCTFCATGTLGELGNLTGGETSSSWRTPTASSSRPKTNATPAPDAVPAAPAARAGIRNVVFMGMGEPLNNYAAVLAALGPMTDPRGFALAPRHVTVSTVGVVPRIRTLARDAPGVRLALSLHAPNQTLRERIVPTATAYPLPRLMEAVDAYLASGPKARAMIEYCVLGGVNDDVAHAAELGELLRGRDVVVNLIPYNPTDVPMGHEPPTEEAVRAMAAVLAKPPYARRTTVRKEMRGPDIAGAADSWRSKTIIRNARAPPRTSRT